MTETKPDAAKHDDTKTSTLSRRYGEYQDQIYARGMLLNMHLPLTTDPRYWEERAKKHLSTAAYNFVSGGAGEKSTMDSNRLAFRQWKLYVFTRTS